MNSFPKFRSVGSWSVGRYCRGAALLQIGAFAVIGVLFPVTDARAQLLGTDVSRRPHLIVRGEDLHKLHRGDDEPMPAPQRRVEFFPRPTAFEARILEAFDDPTTTKWKDRRLEDAIGDLERMHGIEIWIDKRAMQAAGLNLAEQTVSLEITNLPLQDCLDLLLEPLALTTFVEANVLTITTPARKSGSVVNRVYPVGDLCETPEEANQLLDAIEVGLGLSREKDGVRRLAVSSKAKSLIVRESQSTHERLENLLLALRDSQTASAPPKDGSKPPTKSVK